MSDNELSDDPYDIEIDADPYPVYKRLRNEAPLYYNERPDFWGLSRLEDVEAALKDRRRLSSAKDIDHEHARRAPTTTVRGWDSMPAMVG